MFLNKLFLAGITFLISLITISCCTSKNTSGQKNSDKYNTSVSIPPGTADIKGEIIGLSEDMGSIKYKVKIEEVYQYGASTKPLPSGSETEMFISESLQQNESEELREGSVIHVRVSEVKTPGNNAYWEIVKFNK